MRALLLMLTGLGLAAPAAAVDVQAPYAYMVDLQTGTVLLEKNADQKMAPSSMSKIMTAHVIFNRLKSGDMKLTDQMRVSEKAWRMGGSKMFVKVNSDVSVEDLLYGVIVASGNDACIVLAEGAAGTEPAFAEEMNQEAIAIGAKNTHYMNASGVPEDDHYTTPKDLAIQAKATMDKHPKEYEKYYGVKEFTYNKIKQGNRNTLLYKNVGADGVKTGHSDAGGYGSVTSAKQGDRRLILVINGLPTMKDRDEEATKLMSWGFNFFKNYKILEKGKPIEVTDVWGGTVESVELVAGENMVRTLPRTQRKDLKVKISYDAPVAAPLKAGDKVGTIEVTIPEKGVEKVPLLVAKDVEQANFIERFQKAIHYLFYGKHSS